MKKTIGLIIFIALVSLSACTKDADEVKSDSFAQNNVEDWFNKTFKNSKEWKENTESPNKFPDWSKGVYLKKDSVEVFEFPLEENYAKITIPKDKSITAKEVNKVINATLHRLVIVKNDTNMTVRKLYYVPTFKYLQSKGGDISDVMLGKENDDFTGLLITKNWNDAILSYYIVKNGEIDGMLVQKEVNDKITSKVINELDEVVVMNRYQQRNSVFITPPPPVYYTPPLVPLNPYGTGSGGGGGTPNSALSQIEATYQITNLLNGRVKCIYEKLMNSNTGFKNAIQKFDGQFPVSHLKLSINNNLEQNVYGVTLLPVNYVTEIQFNESSFAGLSDLGRATVFAHEIIHAEIFRKMLSAAEVGTLMPDSSNMTPQQQTSYVKSLKNNFPGLYEYYLVRYKPTWNHEMMANHYKSTIADIIQQFDNNRLPRSTYEAVAWLGLGKLDEKNSTIAWEKLSAEQKATVNALIKANFYNGPSTCN